MDMVILKDGRSRPDDLRTLAGLLRRENIGENITVVARAKVPIVKFKESISGIPIDISFNITNGIDSARIATRLLGDLPVLRPMTMVLKHFLMTKVKAAPSFDWGTLNITSTCTDYYFSSDHFSSVLDGMARFSGTMKSLRAVW